jgi:hypothetical protein
MSVPVEPDSLCQMVETMLDGCETKLLAMSKVATPNHAVLPDNGPDSSGCVPDILNESVPLVLCGMMLGILVLLHGVRQAWYAWGGEGAYAFPFDK